MSRAELEIKVTIPGKELDADNPGDRVIELERKIPVEMKNGSIILGKTFLFDWDDLAEAVKILAEHIPNT